MVECQTDDEVASRLEHGVTPHESSDLSLAVFKDTADLRRSMARGAEHDDTQVQLRSLTLFRVPDKRNDKIQIRDSKSVRLLLPLSLLKKGELYFRWLKDGEESAALV